MAGHDVLRLSRQAQSRLLLLCKLTTQQAVDPLSRAAGNKGNATSIPRSRDMQAFNSFVLKVLPMSQSAACTPSERARQCMQKAQIYSSAS